MQPRKRPSFFIVGAPKSGTESLKKWLNNHPKIFIPEIETNYFAPDVKGGQDRIRNVDDYLELFQGTEKSLIGEKSVRYLYSETAAQNIKEFNPNSKIIIILRHPVEVMFSWHKQQLKSCWEYETNFERALFKSKLRMRKLELKPKKVKPTNIYYSIVDYVPQVKRYFNKFRKSNIKIVLFDDLRDRPEQVYREILNFLNVGFYRTQYTVENPSIYSSKKKSLIYFLYLLQKFPRFVRNFIKVFISDKMATDLKESNLHESGRKDLPFELRSKLCISYEDEIQELQALIKKDLSSWRFVNIFMGRKTFGMSKQKSSTEMLAESNDKVEGSNPSLSILEDIKGSWELFENGGKKE